MRILRRLGDAALTMTAAVGALCLVGVLAALVFDIRPVVVRSGSMSPTIDTGALAVTHKVDAADLRVGQIVTVPRGNSHVTHRIVSMTRSGDTTTLRLKGDANNAADADLHQVTEARRYVFSVPWVGYAVAFLSTPPGVYLLAAFVALMVGLAMRGGRGEPRSSSRHARHSGKRAARVGAASGTALMLFGALTTPSWAFWSDSGTVAGTSISAATVPPTPSFRCGALGLLSVTFNWDAVPGADSYTLFYGNAGAESRTVTGTSTTVVSAISNGTAWLVTNREFGSNIWSSVASQSRSYTVAVVSLCS